MKTRYLLGNMKALEEIGRNSLFICSEYLSFIFRSQCIQVIVFRTSLVCLMSSNTIIVINLQKMENSIV